MEGFTFVQISDNKKAYSKFEYFTITRKAMGWKEYWEDLIAKRKLRNVIAQINEIDMNKNGKCSIEEICRNIYNDYNDYANNLILLI